MGHIGECPVQEYRLKGHRQTDKKGRVRIVVQPVRMHKKRFATVQIIKVTS